MKIEKNPGAYTLTAFAIISVLSLIPGGMPHLSARETGTRQARMTLRTPVDSVGFAIRPEQIQSVIRESEKREAEATASETGRVEESWIAGISPHDDYLYAGPVYIHLLPHIKAKRVLLFGVAHRAAKWGIEDRLIFDSFTHWQAPLGPVPVSGLREKILKRMDPESFLVCDSCQAEEHSLEALIPFLQFYNPDVEIVPVLVPYMDWERLDSLASRLAGAVGEIISQNGWEPGKDIAFLISNDCCHYGDQDWGGSNYAPFGCDVPGYVRALEREQDLIEGYLTGRIDPDRIRRFFYRLVDEKDVHQYRITWCGRFSIPLGLEFLHHLSGSLGKPPFEGRLLRYGTSVGLGELPVRQAGLGQTAPSNLHHWVGYVAIGYR